MKVKQLEADYWLFNIIIIETLKITDRLIGYSVKVHSTNSSTLAIKPLRYMNQIINACSLRKCGIYHCDQNS